MKKIIYTFVFTLLLSQGCENKSEVAPNFDLEKLAFLTSKDADFQAFSASNRVILNSIDNILLKMDKAGREKYKLEFSLLLAKENGTEKAEKIAKMIGFNSVSHLYSTAEVGFKRYALFIKNNDVFNELNHEQQNYVIRQASLMVAMKTLSNGRTESCVLAYRDCTQKAETDFAVSSAACSATGALYGPFAWAICQGSAALVYAADGIGCLSSYDDCDDNHVN